MRHAFLAAAASLIFAAAPALAGEQYMSEGYAVSGYDVVAYHDIEQTDVGTPQAKAVRGSPAFETDTMVLSGCSQVRLIGTRSWPSQRNMRPHLMDIAHSVSRGAAKCRATRIFGGLLTESST